MRYLRKILYPLSILYGSITKARNTLYDNGVFKSTSFDFPVIVVGNLNVGGTGKSPQIEYLIRLLKDDYKVAVLSRGYKRATKGFIVADTQATAQSIGDEPLQFYTKFGADVIVAVDADRVHGIAKLQSLYDLDVILLDDAYQHRKVDAGLNILLTAYDNLYTDDVVLPAGDLRENVKGANRAQLIVVTKCPDVLTEAEQFEITKKLNVSLEQTVFFSKIEYASAVIGSKDQISLSQLKEYRVLLVTGIAKTTALTDFLTQQEINFKHLSFKDHHNFSGQDHQKVQQEFSAIDANKKLILTTEKDYVRSFSTNQQVFYLPIKTAFLEHGSAFDQLIKKAISEGSKKKKAPID